MVERHAGGPSHCPREPTWRPWTPPWGPDTAMQTWWGVCWWTSQQVDPWFAPLGKYWSETLHGHRPLCVQCLADSGQRICLHDVDSWQMDGNQCSWCKPLSLRCRTSSGPPGTSGEEGSLSQRWWWPVSPERWFATIFEMLTTVPVSSVSLTGLPTRTWLICEKHDFRFPSGERETLQDC